MRWAESWTDKEVRLARENAGNVDPGFEFPANKKNSKKRAAAPIDKKESLFSIAKRKFGRKRE